MTSSPSGDHDGDDVPGAVVVRGLAGTAAVRPAEYARLPFGRRPGPGGVTVGEDDPRVSREHGALTYRRGWWLLSNSGHTPIEFSPTRLLHADDEPEPLAPGVTTLLVVGSGGRKHPLEVRVNAPDHQRPMPVTGPTLPGRQWPLTDAQRLVLTVLGQQYLRREHRPQPMSRGHVAEITAALDPGGEWDVKKVDRVVAAVRERLSAQGVRGLKRTEVPEPIGNSLNHNLLTELAITTNSLTRADLDVLDHLD
ncbi:FHA domain-containing protein [Amycolatopsis rhabdoformis]|uniref:FHA domain-containing protein n=1 Tax=Amycolatopsis rhabdoformis TaxID=1448059 RepID=A0ABZ1IHA0_9PSEU|nr:FHA domain-containing protein [Amycolatopsis rhabdoformis]WSE32815.1 FHA domain-containing protein [Amycolatopsis rhabdoformis]